MASPAPYYAPPPRRRSIAAPLVLIIIGVLFLLRNFGFGGPLFHQFARWWPLLLLLWGMVALWEYYAARRSGEPGRRMGFGSWVLLILIICCGLSLSGYDRARNNYDFGRMRDDFNIDNDVMGWFGNNYTFDGDLDQDFAPGATLHVVSDRGNVTVTSWDQARIKVSYHKRVFAGTEDEARKTNAATTPKLSAQGSGFTLNANTEGGGSHGVTCDMEISLPRKAALEVSTQHGEITVNGREGGLKLSGSKGDVSVTDLTGDLALTMHGGSLRVSKMNGGVSGEGRFQDVQLSELNGPVTLSGEFFGDMRFDHLAKGINLHTPRTDLEFTRLDGDFNMTMGDIRGSRLTGPILVKTRSKDVDLEDFTGDLLIDDVNGQISLRSADQLPLGTIEVTTTRGDVHVTLPARANFRWSAQTRHGDIQADKEFGEVHTNEGQTATASGVVGSGGPLVRVTSDSGDIEFRRASATPATPEPPAATKPPKKTDTPKPPAKPATPKTPAP